MMPPNVKFSRSHVPQEFKTCTKCGQVFPSTHEYFTRKAMAWDGLQCECKKCISTRAKEYREKHKTRINAANTLYKLNRRKVDHEYRLKCHIGSIIYDALKRKKHKKTWQSLVGYSVSELMSHLQSLFLPGMTWDNYGKWHIDHIKPQSLFKYSSYDDQEFKDCWALKNLQPLWAKDNMAKSNKWEVNF